MKLLLCIFAVLLIAGCNGLGPIDEMIMQPLSVEPSDSDIIGKWEVDSFSYNLIKEQYNVKDQKVELLINKNGTFEAINFPDFVADGLGKSINSKLLNAKGNRKITLENTRVLTMEFDKGDLYKGGVGTSYDLYIKDSQLVIRTFIGDPDQADRLMFIKK